MSFTQALKEDDRFTDIIESGQMNSHSPKKNQYQKMLSKWKELDEKEKLTLEEMISIVETY